MKTYTVDHVFDVDRYKWIVFKMLTASLRERYQVCGNKKQAVDLADDLNVEEK